MSTAYHFGAGTPQRLRINREGNTSSRHMWLLDSDSSYEFNPRRIVDGKTVGESLEASSIKKLGNAVSHYALRTLLPYVLHNYASRYLVAMHVCTAHQRASG